MEPTMKQTTAVTRIERNFLRCILTECLLRLDILKTFMHKKLSEKMWCEDDHSPFPDMAAQKRRDNEPLRVYLHWLETIRDGIEKDFTEICNEVGIDGTFDTLWAARDRLVDKKMEYEESKLREIEEANRIKELMEDFKQMVYLKENAVQQQVCDISNCKSEVLEINFFSKLALKYMNNKTASNLETAIRNCAEIQNNTMISIEEEKSLVIDENFVHQEIVSFLEENIVNMTAELDEWTEKYKTETAQEQEKINALQSEKADNLTAIDDLTERYEEMKRDIDQYMEDKKAKILPFFQQRDTEVAVFLLKAWWNQYKFLFKGGKGGGEGKGGKKGGKGGKGKKGKKKK